MVKFDDIKRAYDVLKTVVKNTPLERSKTFSEITTSNLYLKLENFQNTGSFKIRGAYNKLYHLNKKERDRGVVCASAGNHAQGVAYASKLMDIQSTVFMPIYTPPTKIIATKSYGATVILKGETYDDAYVAAKKLAREKNMVFVPAFNDEYVIAGQGTIGIELYESLNKKIDGVVVPIGGGGLISGIAGYLKDKSNRIQIIGCQPINSPVMYESIKAGKIVEYESLPTLSDGTAGGIEPDSITFKYCQKYVDDYILLSEEEIKDALKLLYEEHGMIVEGAAALSVAAFLKESKRFESSNVVLLISGSKISHERFQGIFA